MTDNNGENGEEEEPRETKVDLGWSDANDAVGIGQVRSIPNDAVTVGLSVSRLRETVALVEAIGWDQITLTVSDDEPVIIHGSGENMVFLGPLIGSSLGSEIKEAED